MWQIEKKKTCLKGSSTLDRFWLGGLTEMVLNPADVLEMAFFGWTSTAWFQRACLAAPVWAVVMTTGGGRGADTGDPQSPSASFRLDYHDEVLHPVTICKYTQPRGRRLCIHALSIVIVEIFDFKKKYDLWVKYNSQLLPPTSSGPYNDLPPSPTALLPCTSPPFPLILPITSPVCAPGGDHTVHLCTLTMFLQRAEADVEVFGLFFRSGPARNDPAKLKANRAVDRFGFRCH